MSIDAQRYLDAQVGVLGSVLISGELAGLVVSRTKANDYEGPYRSVYLAMADIFSTGKPVDPVIVLDKLGREYQQLIMQLMDLTPTAANIEAYISTLQDQSRLRRIRPLAESIQSAPNMDAVQEIVSKINEQLCDRQNVDISTFADCVPDFFERLDKEKKYMPWGFESLDEQLFAAKGAFVILGGYSSTGKTALALNFAVRQAAVGYRIGIFSFETDKGTLFDRFMTSLAKVDLGRIKRGRLTQDDYDALAIITERNKNLPIEFIPAARMTVQDIRARAQSRKYDIIYIDYLQLIALPDERRGRYEGVSGISIALHQMAQGDEITIVALSQLSRPEKLGNKVVAPNMHSLRESGQIEQDADIVMLLYSIDPDDPASQRILKIAKNKEGITGNLALNFDGQTQTFRPGPPSVPMKKKPEPEAVQMKFTDMTPAEMAANPFNR